MLSRKPKGTEKPFLQAGLHDTILDHRLGHAWSKMVTISRIDSKPGAYSEKPSISNRFGILFSENWFNSHVGAIVATVAGLCVFEIITMILSFWLVRSGYSYEMIA